ncbi:MAG TPA: hypothetical protein PKJ94_13820 [Ferruginibacter sp.]|nr:hypothetical protein [Ferruginibacter sp.]
MKQFFLISFLILLGKISIAQNVGIGTTTPGFPLNFSTALGDKISLYGNSGNHYGFGIQGGLLQMHSDAAAANIAFGYGTSAAFTERARFINSGGDGMVLNGRLTIKNGTSPLNLAYGPGIWLYSPDNTVPLGFMGVQNSQNIGFFGGPVNGGWGFVYDAINSRAGIGTSTPTSSLDVNGQVTIDQKNFGGYGGLLIKGNIPGSNYPNIAFSIKNSANTDVVAALIQGELVNNNSGSETIDMGFYTSITGMSSLTQKMIIKGNGNVGIGTSTPANRLDVAGDINFTGALKINANAGTYAQVLTSSGSGTAPGWTSAGNIIKTGASGITSSVNLVGSGAYPLNASAYTVVLTSPSRIILSYKLETFKNCTIGDCSTKWSFNVYLNNNFIATYYVECASYNSLGLYAYATNATMGPDYFDLPAGTHNFTFTAQNRFNEPSIHSFQAMSMIIPQ